jgi:ribosome-associated translation inhibitor RaiA
VHIEIETAEGVEHSTALEEHVHKAAGRLDRRFGDRITRMEVFFKDVRPGKGGVDKSCTLELRLGGMDPVVVETLNENVYDAVRDAVEKLERAVEKRVGRKA